MALIDSWLKEQDSQSDLDVEAFGERFRIDGHPSVASKSLGRGLCLYVIKKWRNMVVIRETRIPLSASLL